MDQDQVINYKKCPRSMKIVSNIITSIENNQIARVLFIILITNGAK